MPADWIKEVEFADIKDGQLYFIAQRPPTDMVMHEFAARGLNGRDIWSQKPGIARKFEGSEDFRKYMEGKPNLIAIEIPADAATRWKARKEKRRR